MQFYSATLLLLAATSVSANDSQNLRPASAPKDDKSFGFCGASSSAVSKNDITKKGYKMVEKPGYQGLFCTSDVACSKHDTCLQDKHGEEDLGFCVPTYALDCMGDYGFGLGAIDKGMVSKEVSKCAMKKSQALKIQNQKQLDNTSDFIGGCCVGAVGVSIEGIVDTLGGSAGIDFAFGSGGNCFLQTYCISVPGIDEGLAASIEAGISLNFVDAPTDSTGDNWSVGFDVDVPVLEIGVGIGIDISCDLTTLLGIGVGAGASIGVEVPWEVATCQSSLLGDGPSADIFSASA